MSNRQPARIPAIDGLRGVAVLLVMAYHFDVGLPGGFLGVDVFFAISGFVVTRRLLHEFTEPQVTAAAAIELGSLRKEEAGAYQTDAPRLLQSPWARLKRFYVGRFWRLFPALGAMVIVVVGASALMDPVLGTPRRNLAHGFSAFVGLSNWFRLLNPDQASEIARPLLHTWSLSIEEQFYACLPLLLTLFRRKIRTAAYAIGGLCVLASMAPLPSTDPMERYFFTLARLAPLGFGVLLAAFFFERTGDTGDAVQPFRQRSARIGNFRRVDIVFVLLAILLLPTLRWSSWNDRSLFPLGLTLIGLVSAGVVGLLTVGSSDARQHGIVAAALESRLGQYLGSRSYSLYLWHFPIAHLFMSQSRPIRTVAWLVLSLVAAEISYRFIESPFRRRHAGHRSVSVQSPGSQSADSQSAGGQIADGQTGVAKAGAVTS
jgi:peptidoglycan/LPS O-acetylase OafA/YrhL